MNCGGPRPVRALATALDLGVLLAAYSVTSPHTIHPNADFPSLLAFADGLGADGAQPWEPGAAKALG